MLRYKLLFSILFSSIIDGTIASALSDKPHLCAGIDTCIKYTITNDDKTNCEISGDMVYKEANNPMAHITDNYVAHSINQYNAASHEGPHVTITLKYHPYDDAVTKQTSDDQILYYSWTDFMTEKKNILKSLNYKKLGLYTLIIEASDYFNTLSCISEALVVDQLPHSVTPCSTTTDPTTLVTRYKAWKTQERGDPYCWPIGKSSNDLLTISSSVTHTFYYAGDTQVVQNDNLDEDSCILSAKDKEALKFYAANSSAAANRIGSTTCKTTCELDGTLGRKSLDYTCATADTDGTWVLSSTNYIDDTCLYNPSAYTLQHTDLFTTSITGKNSLSTDKHVFTTTVTSNEILVNCNGIKSCFEKTESYFTFSQYLDLHTDVKASWSTILGATDSADYIYVRYKIDTGIDTGIDTETWHESLHDAITVNSPESQLIIEVYSGCGSETLQYTLKQGHLEDDTAITDKLCSIFYAHSFKYLENGDIITNDDKCCVHPKTSFVPFSLSLKQSDYENLITNSQIDEVNMIYCEAAVKGQHSKTLTSTEMPFISDYQPLLDETSLKDTKGQVIDLSEQYYALELIKDRTYPYTPLKTRCFIGIKKHSTSGTTEYSNVKCEEFTFYGKDCTSPEVYSCDPYTTCSSDNTKISAGGICSGTSIKATTSSCTSDACTVTTDIKSRNGFCCSDCGGLQCNSLISTNLQFCEVSNTFSVLLRLPVHVMTHYGMFAFMTLGSVVSGIVVAVAMVGMNLYRQRQMIKNEDSYLPLI